MNSGNEAPMISVIVPIYNVEPYLEKCLASLAGQTYRDFEVVLVDDASPDCSMDIARSFVQGDSRFRIVRHAKNRGLAVARNTGVSEARGALISFVDSDDWVSRDYLETLFDGLTKNNADVSVCGRCLAYDDGSSVVLSEVNNQLFSNRVLTREEALRAMNSYRSFDMSMWGKLWKSELFKGVTFPEGKLSEDFFVCYKLLWKSSGTFYQSEPLYFYRRRTNSITSGGKINLDCLEASEHQLAFIGQNCPDLNWVGVTAVAMSMLGIINSYVARGMEPPKSLCNRSTGFISEGLPQILGNHDLPWLKKAQLLFLSLSPRAYMSSFRSLKSAHSPQS